jgi:Caspase domain/WD domain, G-beta repeat
MRRLTLLALIVCGLGWLPSGLTQAVLPRVLKGHAGPVSSLAFSADGRQLVSGSWDHTLKVWDLMAGTTKTFKHDRDVLAVAFQPAGQFVASGSEDKTVRLWNLEPNGGLEKPWKHDAAVSAVAFSPDGNTLISGSLDGTLKVWNLANRQSLPRLIPAVGGQVRSLAFHKDNRTVAVGSSDGMIRVFNAQAGGALKTLSGHGGAVSSLAFSRDGLWLTSGSWDKTIRLWDVATGEQRWSVVGHSKEVWSVAFSPDGLTLISGSQDGRIKRFDRASGTELGSISNLGNVAVRSVAWKDDNTLASGDLAGNINLWDKGEFSRPEISLIAPQPEASINGRSLPLTLLVQGELGERLSFKVRVQNRTLPLTLPRFQRSSTGETVRFEACLPDTLPAGAFTLQVQGQSSGGAQSDPVPIKLNYAPSRPVNPNQTWLRLLAVGISKYADTHIRPLTFADKDALDLAAFFRTQEGKQYDQVETIALPNEHATLEEVRLKLAELACTSGANDTVILFFSGHGFVNRASRYAIPMHDTRFDALEDTALPQAELEDAIGKLTQSRVLVLIDTCHAGALVGGQGGGSPDGLVDGLLQARNDVAIITATKGNELAEERPEWTNGAFTKVLLAGLQGGAANPDGQVTALRLADFASMEVPKLTSDGLRQTPRIEIRGEQFVLAKR